ncbi:MAG: LCCL domain-containing protein [Thermoleophilaceae bacterium]
MRGYDRSLSPPARHLRRLVLLCCLGGLLAPAAAGAATPGGSGWSAVASDYRGQNGAQYDFTCPKYGVAPTIWGTDVYTDDSSVCTAGVHAGVISLAGGGTVTIEIRPGESSYTGSTRNRITSQSYGVWSGSYVVVGGVAQQAGVGDGGSGWDKTAVPFRTWVGSQFTFNCPRGGPPRTIWGTDIYTDDSSVCTAAVHAGLITVKDGGNVTIEVYPGQESYRGSTRYGLKSNPYGAWPASFFVVGAPGGPGEPQGTATGNVLVNGRPFTSGPVPYGATVDVTGGTLQLSARDVGSVTTFGDGTDLARFVLKKSSVQVAGRKRTVAELALTGGNFGSCSAAAGSARAAAGSNTKTVRALWASGKGRFRTKGRFSSATVRGTDWETIDRCDGTLTAVKAGAIVVRDFARKKSIVVKAGKSYLAAR